MDAHSPEPLGGHAARFIARVEAGEAVVGVVGLGYVGLPLALAFDAAGLSTVGFDVDPAKVASLGAGRSYIRHIPEARIRALAEAGRFSATADMARVADVDAVLIAVPTPLTRHREPDMGPVEAAARAIAPHLRPGQLVVLESTTYPTTTEGLLKRVLEAGSGLRMDRDVALAYSPEREDPGNARFTTGTMPKVVGADHPASGDMAEALYGRIVQEVVRVDSTRTAEAVKLTENIFRAVNIGLVNELKVIFERMDIDVFRVVDAARTKPFGYMPFYPGPGLGGHCISVDPFYLTWKAREYDLPTRFIELAGEINKAMPRYVVDRAAEGLSDKLGKAMRGARVLVVGLAYKKNVDDMRESPSLTLIALLEARGATVDYYDPYIPVIPANPEAPDLAGRRSFRWDAAALGAFDCAILATNHDGLDVRALLEAIPVVVDTRDATAGAGAGLEGRIVRA